MINGLELKMPNSPYINTYGKPIAYLSGISHINILVGENNSGKSRFLRSIVNSKNSIVLSNQLSMNQIVMVERFREQIKVSIEKLKQKVFDLHLHKNHSKLSPCEMFVFYSDAYNALGIADMKFDYNYHKAQIDLYNSLQGLYKIVSMPNDGNSTTLSSVPKIYIPILRGIECFDLYFESKNPVLDSISMNADQRKALIAYKNNAQKIYLNKISKTYDIDERSIFTGENLYKEIRNKLLSNLKDRTFVRDFENFVSSCFYNGEGFTIIPIIEKGYLHVKIGQNEERPLHDLGDGIKQIICIMYKAFELRNTEAIICIEEPEINLHPGFQRKLIEILQRDEFSNLTFMISTHSNHIVDSCFDYTNISIFKFLNSGRNGNVFQVINSSPCDIEVLNILGVNNSSVFIANSTIWVEGLSDKIYLSCYLKRYMEDHGLAQYKEGVDYSFIEYGGNNIAHWAFEKDESDDLISASGITNRSFIIVDNDNDAKRKANRKKQLKLSFGDSFFELPVREIENMIKIDVLERTLFDGAPVYKKGAENKRDSLQTKSAYIWKYIDDHYELKRKYWNPHRKIPTISKIEFAKRICRNVNSREDMTETANEVCEKIYKFISSVSARINN